jgi:hypothetical protein
MKVLISDPSAKTKREGNMTVMVRGLTSETNEADLREQFEKVCFS